MTEMGEKVAFIINTASYERVAFALTLALAAAALGKDVKVFFAHGGLIRLKRDSLDEIGEETDSWLRESIRAGLKKGSISPISALLADLQKLGGRIYACPAAMAFHNLVREELIDEVDAVCSVTELVREAVMIVYV